MKKPKTRQTNKKPTKKKPTRKKKKNNKRTPNFQRRILFIVELKVSIILYPNFIRAFKQMKN